MISKFSKGVKQILGLAHAAPIADAAPRPGPSGAANIPGTHLVDLAERRHKERWQIPFRSKSI